MFIALAIFSWIGIGVMEINVPQEGDSLIGVMPYEILATWNMDDFIALEIILNGETAAYLENPPFEGQLNLESLPEGRVKVQFIAHFFGNKRIEKSVHIQLLKHAYEEKVHFVQIPVTFEGAPDVLSPAHFRVYIEGQEQLISRVWGLESPLELVILLDTSGSMVERLPIMRILIKEFISELQDQDRVKIIGFYHQIYEICDFTSNKKMLSKRMLQVKPGGETNLYGALWAGIKSLEKAERRRAILLLTDGRHQMDENQKNVFNKNLEDCLNLANKHMVPIYVLGIGHGTDPDVLHQIAVGTSGRYFQSSQRKKIRKDFQVFLSDLRQQFVLGYYHDSKLINWQKVQVDFLGSRGQILAFPDQIFIQ